MRGCRIDCSVSDPKVNTSSLFYLRCAPVRWSLLGWVALAVWFSQPTSADAVTIESQNAPGVADTNNNDARALLNNQTGEAITLQIRLSGSADDGRFGLTSGQLAVDKNVTLSDSPINLLFTKRILGTSSNGIVRLDSKHTVAIEDLTAGNEFALPTQIVILTAGGIALLFLSLMASYRQLQRPRGKRVRFGILWHAFKPICGKCGSRLSVLNDYSFQCPSCGVELGARGENGKTLSPREALLKIRLKEYW